MAASSGMTWLFPVGAFALLPTAFFVNYGIAVSRNDIQKVWPYISDTGGSPPESCVFGQLVNMSAGLMMVSLYIRHRQIMAFYKATRDKRRKIVISSRIFLGIGLFASFGLQLVANFQEQQIVVSPVHYIGAGIAFFLGLAYGWYQTILSFLTPRTFTPRWLAFVRLVICIVGVVAMVGVFARQMVGQNNALPADYLQKTGRNRSDLPTHFYREPGDPGYAAFITTTVCEWIVGICLALFFLTLAFDLKKVKLHPPKFALTYIDQLSTIQQDFESEIQVHAMPVEYSLQQDTAPSQVLEEELDYRIVVSQRVNKIALPGLAKVEDSAPETSGGNSNFQSSVQRDVGEGKKRGLRRSYDNAIYNGSVDDLEGYIEQNNGEANASQK